MKYKFKTKPRKYQKQALQKLLNMDGGALFMGMGTGKSKVAIDFAVIKHKQRQVNKVLIVAPRLAAIDTWPREIKKHAPPNDIEWRIHTFEYIGGRETEDGIIHEAGFLDLQEWEPDLIIVDEAHKIKRSTAKRSIKLYRLGKQTPYRVAMTGTPVAKSPLDIYGIFKFVDDSVFGTRISYVKQRYLKFGGYMNYKVVGTKNMKEFREKISPWVYQKRKEDMDLPPNNIIPIKFKLKGTRDLYKEMKREKLITVDGVPIPADLPVTRAMKQSQITSGFVFDEDKEPHYLPHTEKLDEYELLLKQMAEEEIKHIVTFCRFKPEMEIVGERVEQTSDYKVRYLKGGMKDEEMASVLQKWRVGGGVLVVQVDTGAESIDLTAANHVVFFSQPQSYITWSQALSRSHRGGQERPVFQYVLIASGTVDEINADSLEAKEDLEKYIMKHPELLPKF